MRRPWQVWLLFVLCLMAVVPAMLWVTSKAFELDRAELAARRQAEQEVEVSRALWSIDARLTPMLAEEAARPDFVYQSIEGSSLDSSNVDASNRLTTSPPYVLLHFELREKGQNRSPQVTTVKGGKGVAAETEPNIYSERLTELASSVSFTRLLPELPQQSLPQLTWLGNNYDFNPAEQQQVVASNAPPLDNAIASAPQSQQSSLNSYASDVPRQQALSPKPQQAESEGQDLRERNAAYQTFAQSRIAQQRASGPAQTQSERPAVTVREGICRPLWIDDKLLFARRVERNGEKVIQGCWLDWAALRSQLLVDIADILPVADLVPAPAGEERRVLATLPVQLIVPPPAAEPPAWSPIRIALISAWGCLALAAGASAWLLQGVVTLSERRASFVSAVTHELRTPLTTFRMYTEMLAADMVTSPAQRQQYLETLCVESDRLTHLVDNVLLYARLERARPERNRSSISVDEMLQRFTSRLADRAEQAGKNLVVECSESTRGISILTDPGAVEQIVFNLIDNACKYAVPCDDPSIVLTVDAVDRWLQLSVRDYGPGLSSQARRRLFQPFSKTSEEAAVSAPGVGLGLALCKRLAAELGGRLDLTEASPGANFVLRLPR